MPKCRKFQITSESGTLIISICIALLVSLLWAGSEANAAARGWFNAPFDALADLFYGGREYVQHVNPATRITMTIWMSGPQTFERAERCDQSHCQFRGTPNQNDEAIEKIVKFFSEHGMSAAPPRNRGQQYISVTGTAHQIESFFDLQINEYRRPHNPTDYIQTYESDKDAGVPPELSPQVRQIAIIVPRGQMDPCGVR